MLNDVLSRFNFRRTPQSRRAREDQVRNHAGGWVFALDDAARLRRFLILGTQGGTFYVGDVQLTSENADVVVRLCRENPALLLDTVADVSRRGAAPKQNATLFALAAAAALPDDLHRARALAMLPQVARTGTHLFLFARYVEQFRGWGRGLRRAVAQWYLTPSTEAVAYQAVKYRQREGWSHRDLLRLAHPNTDDPSRRALFEWIVRRGDVAGVAGLELVDAFTRAQDAGVAEVCELIRNQGLTWEMLPNEVLDQPEVWRTLVSRGMPMTALLRQLGRLTRLGVLVPGAAVTDQVVAQLADAERIRRARIHPIQVLVALRTYAAGRGVRGQTTWTPVRQVVDALDAMFYRTFESVTPTGKRLLLALDVSASMGWGQVAGSPLTPAEATAAMALVTAATEPAYQLMAFADRLRPVTLSPRQRLDDVGKAMSRFAFGGTDCALPMRYAIEHDLAVDAFVVYTDNETWRGSEHPYQALRRYRHHSGVDAKLVVVAMTSTGFSIADPDDAGMLDVVGFDPGVPALMGDFIGS